MAMRSNSHSPIEIDLVNSPSVDLSASPETIAKPSTAPLSSQGSAFLSAKEKRRRDSDSSDDSLLYETVNWGGNAKTPRPFVRRRLSPSTDEQPRRRSPRLSPPTAATLPHNAATPHAGNELPTSSPPLVSAAEQKREPTTVLKPTSLSSKSAKYLKQLQNVSPDQTAGILAADSASDAMWEALDVGTLPASTTKSTSMTKKAAPRAASSTNISNKTKKATQAELPSGSSFSKAPVHAADGPTNNAAPADARQTSWPAMILVDTNSAEDFLFQGLGGGTTQCPHVVRQRQDLGDVVVAGRGRRLVLERKEIGDLAQSITDGRYKEQKARMMYSSQELLLNADDSDNNDNSNSSSSEGMQQEKEETMYMFILEGSRVLPWSKEPATRRGALPCSTLHAALVKTQLRDGFPVLHSSGRDGTVALVQYLFDELCKGGLDLKPSSDRSGGALPYAGFLKKRKRDNLDAPGAVLLAMLSQVPGLSADKATALVAQWPSLSALLAAPESALAAATCNGRRIGPKAAARLFAVLHNGEGD